MKLYDVIEGKLYGSSLPINKEEYKNWQTFDSVVSLTEPYRLKFLNSINYDKEFNVLKSPIPDFDAPEFEQAITICDWINNELIKGKKVVIHCLMGRGRTGTLLACYLIRYCKLNPQQAIDKVRNKNPEAIETSAQENFVKSFY